jgi:hypothetical protein
MVFSVGTNVKGHRRPVEGTNFPVPSSVVK